MREWKKVVKIRKHKWVILKCWAEINYETNKFSNLHFWVNSKRGSYLFLPLTKSVSFKLDRGFYQVIQRGSDTWMDWPYISSQRISSKKNQVLLLVWHLGQWPQTCRCDLRDFAWITHSNSNFGPFCWGKGR